MVRRITNIGLKGKDRRAVEAAAVLLRERFPVDRVVLFGSKACGTDDKESDIDLLVLTQRPLSWVERSAIVDDLFEIEREHDVVITPLVVPTREWEGGLYRVLPIHEEVERDGVVA